LANADPEYALDLFRASASHTFERNHKRVVERGTSLLDLSYSTAIATESDALLNGIHRTWPTVLQTWDQKYLSYGKSIFTALQRSLDGDAVARRFFLTDRWWKQSRWAEVLRSRHSATDTSLAS
jgi:hypothetical protein